MMTPQQVSTEIDRLVDTGCDEESLEKFFLDNYINLPETMQKNVLFAFFTDALEGRASDIRIAKMQEEGLAAIEKIEAFKASLSEKK